MVFGFSANGGNCPVAKWPAFRDGLATDYVTDADLKSAKTLRWEKVKKMK
jgi:hypothetical protein